MSVAMEELYQENEKLKVLCQKAINTLRDSGNNVSADRIQIKLNKI